MSVLVPERDVAIWTGLAFAEWFEKLFCFRGCNLEPLRLVLPVSPCRVVPQPLDPKPDIQNCLEKLDSVFSPPEVAEKRPMAVFLQEAC